MKPRKIVVGRRESGQPLGKVLRNRLARPWSEVRQAIADGRVRINGAVCRNVAHKLTRGLRLEVSQPTRTLRCQPPLTLPSPPGGEGRVRGRGHATQPKPTIRHVDAHIVVVDKPAGLTTMRHPSEAEEFGARARRFLPATLADMLPELLAPQARKKPAVFAVHRLDKDTSGLVVFARTKQAEAALGRQFRAHTVGRCYLAIVRGRAQPGRIESKIVGDRGDGRRGSGTHSGSPLPLGERDSVRGKRAVTHVRIVEQLGDYTLVECRLETGRTHQVRIHLGERGTPLCGERIYDRPVHGAPLPDHSGAPRLALHAAELAFDHPVTGQRMAWTSPLAEDLQALLIRLRKPRGAH